MQIKVVSHLSSDIGVAVPVSPHPGAKEEGGAPNGQLPVYLFNMPCKSKNSPPEQ